MSNTLGLTSKELVQNYGSFYKTTGGGSQEQQQDGGAFGMPSMRDVKRFVRRIMNNRVFDLYLKYLGITVLTPNTLVPIALIMGVQTFHKVVQDMKRNDEAIQRGGKGLLDIKIPVIDDKIIGNGLKLAGVYGLSTISPYTLIPVGVLMLIYEKMKSDDRSRSRSRSKSRSRSMRGGSASPFGTNVPQSLYEQVRSVANGQDVQLLRGQDFDNRNMQLAPIAFNTVHTYAPYQSVSTASTSACGTPNCSIPALMAGGSRRKSKKQRRSNKKQSRKQSRSRSNKKQRGGSSDWLSSVNSRGPTNTLDMDSAQFRMFNQTAPQISNAQLGEANPSAKFYNFDTYRNNANYVPLYKQ